MFVNAICCVFYGLVPSKTCLLQQSGINSVANGGIFKCLNLFALAIDKYHVGVLTIVSLTYELSYLTGFDGLISRLSTAGSAR